MSDVQSGDSESDDQKASAPPKPANDDKMAIENDTGIARPQYDQYAVNDPQSLDKEGRGRDGDEKVERAADDV